ncbi:MAG: protein phosphatase 2C domain-containing protein [Chitinophagales bacterium]|nr:protein phosphatase 2C domain-containing protein [Chitinophagales bacterium]
MPDYPWLFACASVAGAAHIAQQLPCQDYYAMLSIDEHSGVAVVCDGAGSCEHAKDGAQQTVHFALTRFADYGRQRQNQALPAAAEWQVQSANLLHEIATDLRQYAANAQLDFASLSCTVIVLLYMPRGLLCAHIGDGRAAYRTKHGEWLPLISPFHGEEINSTVFITSDIWHDRAQYIGASVVDEPVTAFCLLTDGCERASFEVNLLDPETSKYYDPNRPYAPFFEPNIAALRQLYEQGKTADEIDQLWASFLAKGNEKLRREPDDKTMILATRIQ